MPVASPSGPRPALRDPSPSRRRHHPAPSDVGRHGRTYGSSADRSPGTSTAYSCRPSRAAPAAGRPRSSRPARPAPRRRPGARAPSCAWSRTTGRPDGVPGSRTRAAASRGRCRWPTGARGTVPVTIAQIVCITWPSPGAAAAVAEEAGHRLGPARLELTAQDVAFGHRASLTHPVSAVAAWPPLPGGRRARSAAAVTSATGTARRPTTWASTAGRRRWVRTRSILCVRPP